MQYLEIHYLRFNLSNEPYNTYTVKLGAYQAPSYIFKRLKRIMQLYHEIILYISHEKNSKTGKIHCISLEIWVSPFYPYSTFFFY